MSTKRLARTATEKGKGRGTQHEIYTNNRAFRKQSTAFSHKLKVLADYDTVWDPGDAGPSPDMRTSRRNGGDGSVAQARRWLRAHVGQPWSKVHSRISHLMKINGRNWIKQYLIDDVAERGTIDKGYLRLCDFYVDDDGLLQLSPSNAWNRKFGYNYNDYNDFKGGKAGFLKWINGRKVANYGVSIFWMIPERYEWDICRDMTPDGRHFPGRLTCKNVHRTLTIMQVVEHPDKLLFIDKQKMEKVVLYDKSGVKLVQYLKPVEVYQCKRALGKNWKQGPRMSNEDLARWNKLSKREREEFEYIVP